MRCLLLLLIATCSAYANMFDGIVRLNGMLVEAGCDIPVQSVELGEISSSAAASFPLTLNECHEEVVSNLTVSLEGDTEDSAETGIFSVRRVTDGRRINDIGIIFLDASEQTIIPGKPLAFYKSSTESYNFRVRYIIKEGHTRLTGTTSSQWLTLSYF